MERMVEGGKAIADHFGSHITYLNVLRNMSVSCDCEGVNAEPVHLPNPGILALLIIYFIFKHILLAQNRPESDADGSEVTESLSVIPSQVLSNWKIPDSSSLPFSDNSKLLHPDSNQENTREYVPAKHDHLLLQAKTF